MSKLYTRPELVAERKIWKAEGKKVVLTNGCYDILHPGHIRTLERARSFGDVLILALNTDASVQRIKGPTRPFFDEQTRAALALQLEAVDAVTLFDEDTPRELIAAVSSGVSAGVVGLDGPLQEERVQRATATAILYCFITLQNSSRSAHLRDVRYNSGH